MRALFVSVFTNFYIFTQPENLIIWRYIASAQFIVITQFIGPATLAKNSQNKRTQILQAATGLLARNGLQALSFEAVAHEAGLSRQLVRYYYSNLDALITDLCDHLGNAYRDILVSGVVQVGKVERLQFFLDFFFDLADTHRMPEQLEVYDALVAYSVGSADMRDRLCTQYQTLGQVMVHELAIARPDLDGAACEELSYLFVSMMHTHWSFVATLGYSREHGRLTRQAIDRLIESYANDSDFTPVIERPWARGT